MQTLFSTEGMHRENSFKIWRETLSDRSLPIELERLDDVPFQATIETATVGSLDLTRLTQGAVRANTSRDMIQRRGQDGTLIVTFQLAGVLTSLQDDRSSVQRAGDLVVLDHRPGVLTTSAGHQSLYLELPRERLESVLGSARLFTSMTVGADVGALSLARTFFLDLIKIRRQLAPDTAIRMSEIGIDLIVACLAERLAHEAPRPVHGTLVVQRAKAYVEAHLGDPSLDPPQLAVAMGVSLRRLQELFHERGQHISDWIWDRRLAAAANRLSDRGFVHVPIGTLAYGCGFANQAHFSRRFKERHGLAPRAYRQAALLGAP
ncbi:helix-turn-helix domain-containing protein [Methylobacterium brachiatum]|jgi:AraC-like DNA-binding protein|uniref:AraC-like DNA-binding protein n=1 Tax=Methylobacterium brachiatum TaxID=269660 RepID=A0AAJ1TTY7_9HYPH|nr:helix-turn-helix domain-containing protein [Methylobacterium brachiatum]MCB4803143.1 helix-turn-helix domain-containing protein [Methylobacterium brachiatum]MDQ0543863.1 AraC-like DNA-binding protein [Methylobacterium brachiatum]SFI62899.1 AraC-type DNA-binding protein [Methylobacterium brachiatum]